MGYRDYKTKYNYMKPLTIATLIYAYDNNGQVIGFRELVQKLDSNNQAIRETLMYLEYNRLITRDSGPNNIMIIKLTDKGVKATKLLKQLIKILEE